MSRSDFASSITYSQESDFSFDSNYIEYSSGIKLKLIDNPGQDFTEPFDSSAGHTFDSNVGEFVGGNYRQINKRPTDAICYNNFKDLAMKANPEDLNFGATKTGTLGGDAEIVSDVLVLSGNAYWEGNPDNIATMLQQGCVRLLWRPGYTGNATAVQELFQSNASTTNRVHIRHNSNLFQCYVYNSSGVLLFNMSFAWTPSTIKWYEIELNFDATGGNARVFIDGQVRDTDTGTGTRSSNNLFRVGASSGMNSEVSDVLIFDSVQHTSNYTPDWSGIPDADFLAGYDTLPEMEYTGAGTLKVFDSLTYTVVGNMLIALQIGQSGVWTYWDGGAWATGDGTKDFMCTVADFAANVGTLNIDGEIYGQFKIFFPISYSQGNIDELTASLTAQIYPLTNPEFTTANSLTADELLSIVLSETIAGSDNIKYSIKRDDDWLYWDGLAWSASSSYATANTSSDIENNIGDLDNSDENIYYLKGYLHSNDGTTTPTFTSAVLKYFTLNFVVEDGTSKTDSTSYATLTQFYQYWINKRTDYSSSSIVDIKQWLNSATEYIDITYNFKGSKTDENQALEWPRYNVEKDSKAQNYSYNNYYDSDEMPTLLVNATCYIAAKVASGELNATVNSIRSSSVGPISKTYSGNNQTRYTAIDKMLKSLIIIGNRLERVN